MSQCVISGVTDEYRYQLVGRLTAIADLLARDGIAAAKSELNRLIREVEPAKTR